MFGRQRHNLNKLGRGSQDDATNIISRLKPIVVSDKNIFYVFGPMGHYLIMGNKPFVYYKPLKG